MVQMKNSVKRGHWCSYHIGKEVIKFLRPKNNPDNRKLECSRRRSRKFPGRRDLCERHANRLLEIVRDEKKDHAPVRVRYESREW